MEIMLNFFDYIFSKEWKYQQKLMLASKKSKKGEDKKVSRFKNTLFILSFICFYLSIEYPFVLICSFVFITLYYFSSLKLIFIFTTVRGFLIDGIKGAILISLFLYRISGVALVKYKVYDNSYIRFIVFAVILNLVWIVISTLCNYKVATLSNAILAAIITLTLQLNSFIWNIFIAEGRDFVSKEALSEIIEYGFSQEQWLMTMINLLLYPIFAMSVIGALSCAFKGYWINKYNDGKDIENIRFFDEVN